MYFIVSWLFYDFCCLRYSSGSIFSLNKLNMKPKIKQIDWFPHQNKNHALPSVLYTKWKIFHFFGSASIHKSSWLLNEMSDFCQLDVKISVKLKRKRHSWSSAAKSEVEGSKCNWVNLNPTFQSWDMVKGYKNTINSSLICVHSCSFAKSKYILLPAVFDQQINRRRSTHTHTHKQTKQKNQYFE